MCVNFECLSTSVLQCSLLLFCICQFCCCCCCCFCRCHCSSALCLLRPCFKLSISCELSFSKDDESMLFLFSMLPLLFCISHWLNWIKQVSWFSLPHLILITSFNICLLKLGCWHCLICSHWSFQAKAFFLFFATPDSTRLGWNKSWL